MEVQGVGVLNNIKMNQYYFYVFMTVVFCLFAWCVVLVCAFLRTVYSETL